MINKERVMRRVVIGGFCVLALGCGQSAPPDSGATSTGRSPVTTNRDATANSVAPSREPADRTNTGVNVRDRDSTAKTPIDQGEKQGDIQITADIRKRITATEMSVDAKNVKIITQDGKVTLRGPVNTKEEKQKVEELASAVAGDKNVDSQLEVANK